jgi:hypothetical protein
MHLGQFDRMLDFGGDAFGIAQTHENAPNHFSPSQLDWVMVPLSRTTATQGAMFKSSLDPVYQTAQCGRTILWVKSAGFQELKQPA